jgi:hypothetical protein
LFALTAVSSRVASGPEMNVSNMWWETSEIDTPVCHAACSWRQPAYPGSTTSGSHGVAFGFQREQLGLQTWVSDVFYGGVLVISVTISTLLRRRST